MEAGSYMTIGGRFHPRVESDARARAPLVTPRVVSARVHSANFAGPPPPHCSAVYVCMCVHGGGPS